MVPAHHGLRRSPARRFGGPGLAGARQAPAASVDRSRRRRHDPAARLADLAPALLGPADTRSCTATRAVRSQCPTPSCRSSCPTSTTSGRRAPAGHPSLPSKSGCGRHVRAAAGRRAARPTSATRSSIRRGTSCATRRPTSTTVRGTPRARPRALPVDFYAGGPEHVQRHHLYAAVRDDGAARSRAGAVRGAVPAGAAWRSDRQGRGEDVEEPRQRRDARRLHRPPRCRHVAVRAAVLGAVGTGR